MDRVVRDVAPLNTPTPILVTELGMDRLVRDIRSAKALLPILVTELGMDRLVRDIALEKASLPMDVTPGAITTAPAHDVPFETTPFVMV